MNPPQLWILQIGFLEIWMALPIEDCMQLVRHLGVVLRICYVQIDD